LLKILFGEMRERKVVVGCFGKGERGEMRLGCVGGGIVRKMNSHLVRLTMEEEGKVRAAAS
jgi:hypothetical protein